jgi:O-succinylhomoserine sulfhydrylase
MDKKLQLSTQAVRVGQARSQFQEHAEALFLTSSFVFDNAAQAQARFVGGDPGVVYSRYTNPTVSMFQDRLAALEGAEACIATSSGMSAILATAMSLLRAGEHIVCSGAVFGATVQLFTHYFGRFGVETTYVSPTKVAEWETAVRKNTKLFFLETPSNPLTEVSDIAALSKIAKSAGALLAVDNVFCTPALQRPLDLGADLVIHSATKHLDGQGRVLGGAVLGPAKLVNEHMLPFLRTAGPSLSPFNAWVILKGLETLELRMRAQSAAALELAQWLEAHPAVARVFYPGLASHP